MNPWNWKESIVYEVYPRSFMDSDGDGIGDLPGVISRLDHIQELGADVVWITPVYPSPNADYGYDISDYCDIAPEYGTMEDWEELRDSLHRRGMKLMMDLVLNHTSDEHPWFREARKSRDNPYRDYYIWRDPGTDGGPPNNWTSYLGGSAWEWEPETKQYYLHIYGRKQPDLNWDNPKVRAEMHAIMEFWLEKGVDAFRIDAANILSKNPSFPDTGSDKKQGAGEEYYRNGEHIHDYYQEMHRKVLSRYPVITAGETAKVSPEDAERYTAPGRREMNMILMIEASKVAEGDDDLWDLKRWDLADLKGIIKKWQTELKEGWIGLYFSNHDHPRLASYLGDAGQWRRESASMLAVLALSLRGTPFIYQGDEIGMTNSGHFARIEDFKEQQALEYYRLETENGAAEEEVLAKLIPASRDQARTPMQWEDGEGAGFTTGIPWIGLNPNADEINVRRALADPNSVFAFYKKMIRLRKETPALVHGSYEPLLEPHPRVFAYIRALESERLLVVLNFSKEESELDLPAMTGTEETGSFTLLIGNYPDLADGAELPRYLRPYEALVFRMI